MKTSEEFISEIEKDISSLKLKGRKWYYQINAEMTLEIMEKVEFHFKQLGYITDFRRCFSCKNNVDVIIGWNE